MKCKSYAMYARKREVLDHHLNALDICEYQCADCGEKMDLEWVATKH